MSLIGFHAGMMALGAGGDPFWGNVKSLLNSAGADGSTTAIDETGRIWTSRGSFQIDDSTGHNVMLFDGSTASADTPYIGSDFDWWTQDYTIDAVINPTNLSSWAYTDGDSTPQMIASAEPGTFTNYWSFGPNSAGALVFYYFNGSSAVRISAGSVPTNTETFVRITHTLGQGIRLFINGSIVSGPTPVTGSPIPNASGAKLTLGYVMGKILGSVRAIRITKGTARTDNPGTPPWPTNV